MHYIDGYNLLFRLSYHHKNFTQEREQIIEQFSAKLNEIQLEATIVFDATRREGLGAHTSYKYLHVIFTAQNETADEWILAAIKRSPKPYLCTVITSDRTLTKNVKIAGAIAMSVETFLSWLNKKKKVIPKAKSPPNIEHYLKIFEERLKSQE